MVWVIPPILILFAVVAGKKENVGSQSLVALITFFWISLLAALRYQTGGDWDGYENYFEAIDVHSGIFEGYVGNPLMLQFEPGYYVVGFVFKYFGLPYFAVDIFSVFVFVFAVLRLTHKESLPPYIIVLIFIGLPQLTLYYNQVRQTLAIGFVLMAIQSKTKKSFFAFGILALSFQVSSIVFLVLSVIAKFKAGFFQKIFRAGVVGIPIAVAFVAVANLNAYDLLKTFLPENLQFKIDIYQEEETGLGVFRFATILYIIFSAVFLFISYNKITIMKISQKYIIRISLLCSFLVPYSVVLFPNSYAFFNRGLVFTLILFSLSGSILHKYELNNSGQSFALIPFYGLGFISIAYYFVSLYIYGPVYIPYKSFVFQ